MENALEESVPVEKTKEKLPWNIIVPFGNQK